MKQMVAKQQRITSLMESCIEQFTLSHNVKIHNMILKKVGVPTKDSYLSSNSS